MWWEDVPMAGKQHCQTMAAPDIRGSLNTYYHATATRTPTRGGSGLNIHSQVAASTLAITILHQRFGDGCSRTGIRGQQSGEWQTTATRTTRTTTSSKAYQSRQPTYPIATTLSSYPCIHTTIPILTTTTANTATYRTTCYLAATTLAAQTASSNSSSAARAAPFPAAASRATTIPAVTSRFPAYRW